jgi:hypothetical protein
MATIDPRTFEQLMNQARIKLPGSSDAGIKVELFDVMKEFLKDSNAWTEDITFTVQPNTTDYLLTPLQDGGQIIRLVGVWDDKMIPVPAFMPTFGTIRMVNQAAITPNQPVWTARVIKNITLPTTRDDIPVGPDWLLTVYSLDILDGLLGKMMGQQAKSYSNGTMSTYHLRRFRTAIQSARTAAIRQNTQGAQEWAFPRGWKTSTQRGGVSTAWPTRAF